MGRYNRTLKERLYEKVVYAESGCIEWARKTRLPEGYGRMAVNGKQKLVHRVSYEISIGPIPDGLLILHHCDNPPCINPSHLFLGTKRDNSDDKVRKGRHRGAPGIRNRKNKLTETQVLSIREDTRQTMFIATDYGIAKSLVRKIKRRSLWKHLP